MPFGPFILQWRAPNPNPPQPTPLPTGLSRTTITTPSGPLELLYAHPAPSKTSKTLPPLFFGHGGFGCAEVWSDYMLYFAARGYACYAVSYRGHGGSWYPGFWRMLWVGRDAFGEDLVAGIAEAGRMERKRRGMDEDVEVVLVAHSAGGALSQYVLGKGRVRVKALCLFAAVPGFGSAAVYTFWLPIVPIQMPYRLFHPRYPLATTSAVKSSFFSPGMPLSRVSVFERLLAPYESLRWPLQMLPPVGKAVNILRSITGWRTGAVKESDGSRPGHTLVNDCLFVLAAEHDVLCRPPILRAMAQKYRQGLADLIAPADPEIQAELTDPDADPKDWEGVRFRIVKGVAHHMQNEVEWERGAEGIAIWLDGLEQ